jgi:hypothetical protein
MSQSSGTALKTALDVAIQNADSTLSIPVLPLDLAWVEAYKPVIEIANLPQGRICHERADAHFFALVLRLTTHMGYSVKDAEREVLEEIQQCARISYPRVAQAILKLFASEEAATRRKNRNVGSLESFASKTPARRAKARKPSGPEETGNKPTLRPIVFEDI